jgi:hypothetical protein
MAFCSKYGAQIIMTPTYIMPPKPTCKVVKREGQRGARIDPKGCKVRTTKDAQGNKKKENKQGNEKIKRTTTKQPPLARAPAGHHFPPKRRTFARSIATPLSTSTTQPSMHGPYWLGRAHRRAKKPLHGRPTASPLPSAERWAPSSSAPLWMPHCD